MDFTFEHSITIIQLIQITDNDNVRRWLEILNPEEKKEHLEMHN